MFILVFQCFFILSLIFIFSNGPSSSSVKASHIQQDTSARTSLDESKKIPAEELFMACRRMPIDKSHLLKPHFDKDTMFIMNQYCAGLAARITKLKSETFLMDPDNVMAEISDKQILNKDLKIILDFHHQRINVLGFKGKNFQYVISLLKELEIELNSGTNSGVLSKKIFPFLKKVSDTIKTMDPAYDLVCKVCRESNSEIYRFRVSDLRKTIGGFAEKTIDSSYEIVQKVSLMLFYFNLYFKIVEVRIGEITDYICCHLEQLRDYSQHEFHGTGVEAPTFDQTGIFETTVPQIPVKPNLEDTTHGQPISPFHIDYTYDSSPIVNKPAVSKGLAPSVDHGTASGTKPSISTAKKSDDSRSTTKSHNGNTLSDTTSSIPIATHPYVSKDTGPSESSNPAFVVNSSIPTSSQAIASTLKKSGDAINSHNAPTVDTKMKRSKKDNKSTILVGLVFVVVGGLMFTIGILLWIWYKSR